MDQSAPTAVLGSSAGTICFTPPDEGDPNAQALGQAAEVMWESLRSAWVLLELWNNGTSVWASPDGDQTAVVSPDGSVQVRSHR